MKTNFTSQPFLLVVFFAITLSLAGCDSDKDGKADNAKAETNNESTEEDEGSSGLAQQAQEMFEKAKEAGMTSASNASEWVNDQWSGMVDGTNDMAQDTSDWVTETYESLRDRGMTTANDATQWVQDDFNSMYAFEYKVLAKSTEGLETLESELNQLGAQSWECFATDENAFYFKRQKKSYLRNVPVKDLLKFLPMGGAVGVGE